MTRLTTLEKEKLMSENEKEHLYYERVRIDYMNKVLNDSTGNYYDHRMTELAAKIKIDNKELFIVIDRYADSEPYCILLKKEELNAEPEFVEKRIFTFDNKKHEAWLKGMPYVEKGITEASLIKIQDIKSKRLKM